MKCDKCGKIIDSEIAKFCPNCGVPITKKESAPSAFFKNAAEFVKSGQIKSKMSKAVNAYKRMDLSKRILAAVLALAIVAGSVAGIVSCAVCTCAPEEKAPAKLESSSFCLLDFNYVDYQVNDKDTAKQAVVDASSLLGLEDTQATLQFTNETKTFDTTVYRFDQSWNGIPVYGRSAALLCDASGTVLSYTGNLADIDDSLKVPASVQITEETTKTIIDSINAYYGSDYRLLSEVSFESDDAVIYIKDGKSVLAYRIDVCFGTDEESYYERFIIDIENGEVLCCEVLINDNGISQSKTVETSAAVNNVNVRRPNVNIEISRFNDGVVSYVKNKRDTLVYYADGVPVNPGSSEWTANGQTFYNSIDVCLDFYWEKFARNSYDNAGGTINAYYNDMYDSGNNAYAYSAFIDSTDSFPAEIYHLRGEGVISFGKNRNLGAIDLFGHEFTHIVTYCTWHPSAQKGETSAVNEALSDIFGQLIEHYASGTSDWIQGDRNIADPGSASKKYGNLIKKEYRYPDTYMGDGWLDTSSSLDDGGEHHNSTVLSHAAYEMTRTGQKGKLTYDQLGELWYRTMLNLPSDSKFSDVRACVESTAQIMLREGKLDKQNISRISEVFDEANITSALSSNYNIAPGAKLTVLHNDNTVDNTYNILIVENAANRFSFKINESVETGFEFPSDMKSGTYQVYISPSDGSVKEVISFSVEIKKRGTDELKIYTDFEPPLIIVLPEDQEAQEKVIPFTEQDIEKFEEMLQYTTCLWPYSYSEETGTVEDIITKFLVQRSLGRSGLYLYFWGDDYLNEYYETDFDTCCDPLDKFYGFPFFVLDADKVDWIISNVFGKEPDRTAGNEEFYYYEDKVYLVIELDGYTETYFEEGDYGHLYGENGLEDIKLELYRILESDEYTPFDCYHVIASFVKKGDNDPCWRIHKMCRTSEEETDETTDTVTGRENDEYVDLWKEVPDLFGFGSGVGSWGTEITISDDGTFVGEYSHTDMSDSGDLNPHGTRYICNFNGRFSVSHKISDTVYYLKLEDLSLEKPEGEIYYESGLKYVCTGPYGLENTEGFYLYMPGTPMTNMEENFLGWTNINPEISQTMPSGIYGIYNINEEQGFVSSSTDSIWGKYYYIYFEGRKSAFWPTYSSSSKVVFWPEEGAAVIQLCFNWDGISQGPIAAYDSEGSGDYELTIEPSDDLIGVRIKIVSESGKDLSAWGGTEDGTLVAKYICES